MFQQIMRHSEINGSECHMLNTKVDWCIKYGEFISWFINNVLLTVQVK